METAKEGFVEVLLQVRRENHEPLIVFDGLQQIIDFNVGVAIVCIFDFGPLTKKRMCLVEEEQAVA